MLRYKTETRPGLVALYDIRPGNRAGLFLQPWSPHGVSSTQNERCYEYWWFIQCGEEKQWWHQ